jgi:hypothetical protein
LVILIPARVFGSNCNSAFRESLRDHLRCKTLELVHKEIWTHILAYNLIRTIMAQAAVIHDLMPRRISFKGVCQLLEAFQPVIQFQAGRDSNCRLQLYQHLLDAIATRTVADRPDRFEPRLKKGRPTKYDWMMTPRAELKRMMAKGVMKIQVPFGRIPRRAQVTSRNCHRTRGPTR